MDDFGMCSECGGPIDPFGWDEFCDACQESEKAGLEQVDDRWADQDEDCGSCSCIVYCEDRP